MHILFGAIIGMVVSVGLTYVASRVIKKPLSWKDVAASAMAGIVGGAIASATLGVGAATTVRTVVAFSAGGATGSASGQVTDNILYGHAVEKDLVKSTLFGTAVGAGTLGVGKALAPVAKHVTKLIPSFSRGATAGATTAASGHGGGGNSVMAGFAAGLDDAIVPVTRYVKKALAMDDPAGEESEESDAHAATPAQVVASKDGAVNSLEQALSEQEPETTSAAGEEEASSAWIQRLRSK